MKHFFIPSAKHTSSLLRRRSGTIPVTEGGVGSSASVDGSGGDEGYRGCRRRGNRGGKAAVVKIVARTTSWIGLVRKIVRAASRCCPFSQLVAWRGRASLQRPVGVKLPVKLGADPELGGGTNPTSG
ncbi:hypothetical protein B0H12DRAFT_1082943 [Mycena haematopus]|nr:hypothetical protein B0H12DRAFT_1082943 [Mycena haematopus]